MRYLRSLEKEKMKNSSGSRGKAKVENRENPMNYQENKIHSPLAEPSTGFHRPGSGKKFSTLNAMHKLKNFVENVEKVCGETCRKTAGNPLFFGMAVKGNPRMEITKNASSLRGFPPRAEPAAEGGWGEALNTSGN